MDFDAKLVVTFAVGLHLCALEMADVGACTPGAIEKLKYNTVERQD